MRILVVEDEYKIADIISSRLKEEKYTVDTSLDGEEGLYNALTGIYDLILLDVMLPKVDGFEILKKIKEEQISSKVIMLTAKGMLEDKLHGFNIGVDDYITKPFGTAELLARVRAALRASRNRARVAPSNLFTVDDLVIDYDRRQVSVGGSPVHLTQTEYNILALLSQHTGKVLTYATIIRSVWGSMDDGSVKKLQVNMANIRKKLGCRPGDSRYVINELGVGYRIADE